MKNLNLASQIGSRIKQQCLLKNISQKDLAKAANITEAGACRYVAGQRLPRVDILMDIADALGVSIDYLIYGV